MDLNSYLQNTTRNIPGYGNIASNSRIGIPLDSSLTTSSFRTTQNMGALCQITSFDRVAEVIKDQVSRPEYITVQERLNTFNAWPNEHIQSKAKLAEAGFISVSKHGVTDCVECFCCGIKLYNWECQDNAWYEHRKWAKKCAFVTKCIANIPSVASELEGIENQHQQQQQNQSEHLPETTQEQQPTIEDLNIDAWARCVEDKVRHPEYLTVQNRLKSFHDWPYQHIQNTKTLAQAGLFAMIPMLNRGEDRGDNVKCFCCGYSIYRWEPNDDPWYEHKKWSNQCDFILKCIENIPSVATRIKAIDDHQTSNETKEKQTCHEEQPSTEVSKPEDLKLSILKLEEENERLKKERTCCICLDSKVEQLFLPCSHMVCCMQCSLSVTQCPICRKHIKATARVYL